jgi:hypothetical protein
MGVLRSKLGWVLVVIYVVAFITVYSHAQDHRGTFVGRMLLQQPTFVS